MLGRKWEETFGSIPDGLYVMHSCDNPWCANPKHLQVGTQSANLVDSVLKGRWVKSDRGSEQASLRMLTNNPMKRPEMREKMRLRMLSGKASEMAKKKTCDL